MYKMLWRACIPVAPLWLWVPSFIRVFWFVGLRVRTIRGNPVFRRAIVNPMSLVFLGGGVLGSSHFGYKCKSLGSFGVTFLSLEGGGYLGF